MHDYRNAEGNVISSNWSLKEPIMLYIDLCDNIIGRVKELRSSTPLTFEDLGEIERFFGPL